MTLDRLSAPATTPVSVAEVKAQMRVDHDDDDTLIGTLVDAAVDMVDGTGKLGRAMVTQSWGQWADQAPGWVPLRMGPVQALTAVDYYDADGVLQAATLSDFEIFRDGELYLAKPKSGAAWPAAQVRPDAIRISWTAGFGDDAADVPAGLRAAIKLIVAHWYEHREAVTVDGLADLPMGADMLIGLHRVGWYG